MPSQPDSRRAYSSRSATSRIRATIGAASLQGGDPTFGVWRGPRPPAPTGWRTRRAGPGTRRAARTASSPCCWRSSHGSSPVGSTATKVRVTNCWSSVKARYGGLLPGGVAVEGEDHLAAERVVVHQQAAQHLDVVAAERRAAGGDRGVDAGQVAGHHVGVALDDDRALLLGDLALGQVEAVEHLALLVDRRLGGVEVLRAVVVGVAACARRSRRRRRRGRGSARPAARGTGRRPRAGPGRRGRRRAARRR